MIVGRFARPGQEAIPDENLEEPIEFYTKPQSQMNNLKIGDRVKVTIKRNNSVNTADINGQEATIQAVDNEDNRTMFPYWVQTKDGASGWVKESEVTLLPTSPDTVKPLVLACIGVFVFMTLQYKACTRNITQNKAEYSAELRGGINV